MKFKRKTKQPPKATTKEQLFKYPIVLNQQSVGLVLASLGLLLSSFVILIGSPKALIKLQNGVFQSSLVSSPKLPPVLAGDIKVASPSPNYQIIDSKLTLPQLSSVAVLAEDLDSEQLFFQKNIHARLFPASTTKIMTALVALDYYKSTDVLTVPKEAMVSGSSMGLIATEKLTFRSLLYGMMLNSGNDAAYTIALNYPGGMDNFVGKMNEKVDSLGLLDTHFQDPAGFDHPSHYSSAYDMAKIAKKAMENEQFARIVATKETQVVSLNQVVAAGNAQASAEATLVKTHLLRNLNKLLTEQGVLGIKTGTTDKAGENLVALIDRNGHKILTVVFGSSDRFEESKSLIGWVYRNYQWKVVSN